VLRSQADWTVPLTSFSGIFGDNKANRWNRASQYNYAAKHNPILFFTDTNRDNDSTSANGLSSRYTP